MIKKLTQLTLALAVVAASIWAANEISISGQLSYANASAGISSKTLSVSKTLDITGFAYAANVWTVPTSSGGTAIPVGNLTNVGWLYIKNNDATNYVTVYTAVSGTAFAKILPGEFMFLRVDPGITAPAAKANTATVKIEYLALEI